MGRVRCPANGLERRCYSVARRLARRGPNSLVCTGNLHVALLAPPGDAHVPRVAAYFAVLHEGAPNVRLEVDLHCFPAIRADDRELGLHAFILRSFEALPGPLNAILGLPYLAAGACPPLHSRFSHVDNPDVTDRRITYVGVLWLLAAAGAAASHRRRMPHIAPALTGRPRQAVVVSMGLRVG